MIKVTELRKVSNKTSLNLKLKLKARTWALFQSFKPLQSLTLFDLNDPNLWCGNFQRFWEFSFLKEESSKGKVSRHSRKKFSFDKHECDLKTVFFLFCDFEKCFLINFVSSVSLPCETRVNSESTARKFCQTKESLPWHESLCLWMMKVWIKSTELPKSY